MRSLSQLFSVSLALFLMGLSLATASAHGEPTDHTADDHVADTDGAIVLIVRVGADSPIYPGDELKFRVLIRRGVHNIPISATLMRTGVAVDADPAPANVFASADPALAVIDDGYFLTVVKYSVRGDGLGNAVSRNESIQFSLAYSVSGDDYSVKSNAVAVSVLDRPDTAVGASEVSMLLSVTEPDDIAVG